MKGNRCGFIWTQISSVKRDQWIFKKKRHQVEQRDKCGTRVGKDIASGEWGAGLDLNYSYEYMKFSTLKITEKRERLLHVLP